MWDALVVALVLFVPAGERWPRLDGIDPVVALNLRRALDEAAVLLLEPACEALVDEFHDAGGRPLRDQLDRLEVTAPDYLDLMLFREAPQRRDAIAFTSPGSRVVFVHGPSLERTAKANPDHLVATVIHELLHSLGLGENPPTSAEITGRVTARCQKTWNLS